MALKKSQLYSSIWASCNELCGGMGASQYRDYVLVHEFCHLKEKKHNDAFVRLIDKNLPKWRIYKDELNQFVLSHEQ